MSPYFRSGLSLQQVTKVLEFVLLWAAIARWAQPLAMHPWDVETRMRKWCRQHEVVGHMEKLQSHWLATADVFQSRPLSERTQDWCSDLDTTSTCFLSRLDSPASDDVALPVLSHMQVRPSIGKYGHHRAACSMARVLRKWLFAVESAAARICRDGCARVTTNVLLRAADLAYPNALGR